MLLQRKKKWHWSFRCNGHEGRKTTSFLELNPTLWSIFTRKSHTCRRHYIVLDQQTATLGGNYCIDKCDPSWNDLWMRELYIVILSVYIYYCTSCVHISIAWGNYLCFGSQCTESLYFDSKYKEPCFMTHSCFNSNALTIHQPVILLVWWHRKWNEGPLLF